MKIASAGVAMAASHQMQQAYSLTESTRFWVGSRPSDGDAQGRSRHLLQDTASPRDPVQLSAAGKAAAADDEVSAHDPLMRLIRSMIEYLMGKRMQVFDPAALQPGQSATAQGEQPSAGYGYEYQRHESWSESESMSFEASGTVQTADGQSIQFNLSFSMAREYHEESDTQIRAGDAVKTTDPLILNFGGTAAQLSDTKFAFDLNADGAVEQVSQLGAGSGFLAFDRNQDGQINNGRELFGPGTGNGFGELAALDDDGNGWIDENDRAFGSLAVWRPDAQGKGSLQSLLDAGVGAISLQQVSSPFAIKDAANRLQGQVQSSGVFLQENGQAGSIQQVDLAA